MISDMKRYLLIAAAFAMMVSGCQKEGALKQDDSNVIRIAPSVGGALTRATGTSFDANDRLGLYAVEYSGTEALPLQIGGNFLNDEPFTYNGTSWSPRHTLYWPEGALDFYACYPYVKFTSVEDQQFELATDQSTARTADTLGGYEASDLMIAKTVGAVKDNGAVALNFKHVMSKLVVKIVKGETYVGTLPKNIAVHIYNTNTTASVNLAKGVATKYSYGEKKTIIAKQVDSATFNAIVVPQHIETLTPLVEITMDGVAYLLDYSISFLPGYMHTINVTLKTSPGQEKIEISIDGTINDWQ
jgi:hypothetical protein